METNIIGVLPGHYGLWEASIQVLLMLLVSGAVFSILSYLIKVGKHALKHKVHHGP